MANKLRNKSARVSFFAFQDMITTVTGVLMIMMLMLSLDLTREVASASAAKPTNLQHDVEQARQRLDANVETLRERRVELSAMTNRVFVIPERDQSGKEPVLIVLSATNGWVTWLGQTNRIEFKVNNGRTTFKDVMGTLDAQRDRLVFYVRPSGISHFEVCRDLAKRRGFDIGYDAADEDRHYVLAIP